MEVLIVDDASDTPVYDALEANVRHVVRYHRNPQTLGIPGSWDKGIALSRGRWIHVLHDDDYVLPGFYGRLRQSLEGSADSVAGAFTGYENIDEAGKILFRQQACGGHRGVAKDWISVIGVANPLNMPAVVVRRSAHERLGGYHGDWELYKRIAAFGEWWSEPDILARYREHARSKTKELLRSGRYAVSIRRAIEMSHGYFPAAIREPLTHRARQYYFDRCLAQLAVLTRTGDRDAIQELFAEVLRISPSSEARAKLFGWLATPEATSLREVIAARLLSQSPKQ
jgi:glycosyltransferase involved in cell wall biosynthesis